MTADPAELAYFSTDISGADRIAALVAAPGSVEDVQAVVAIAVAAGYAVVARGGGFSYTKGYVPTRADTVLLDLRRLDRVVEISAADRYVVVEVGCTWAKLHDALTAVGLRLPSFGPLSGIAATIGGGLSQNAGFFGTAAYGLIADSVLGLEAVVADGSLIATGAMAHKNGPPFFRQFGPDLTGLFLGDAGAFAIKTRATFRVIRAPAAEAYASFAFDDHRAMLSAQLAVIDTGAAADCYGFDTVTNEHMARLAFDKKETAAFAADLAKSSRGPVDMIKSLWQASRRRDTDDQPHRFTLHIACEGADEAEADLRLRRARGAASAFGREIPDTVPRITRAKPFRRIRALLGPSGENWLPVHGVLPASRAIDAFTALQKFRDDESKTLKQAGIEIAVLTFAGEGYVTIEPQFFWTDSLSAFLDREIIPAQRAITAGRAENQAARALVHETRQKLVELLDSFGAVHFQTGKYYRLNDRLAPGGFEALHDIKDLFDPPGAINPGALGLE